MTEQIPTLEGQSYHNFIRYTCRNPITKSGYLSQLRKFAAYSNVKNYDELLFNGDISVIESNIENYLMYLQDRGYASSSVLNAKVVIANFYFYNRVQNLNWKIMNKVLKLVIYLSKTGKLSNYLLKQS